MQMTIYIPSVSPQFVRSCMALVWILVASAQLHTLAQRSAALTIFRKMAMVNFRSESVYVLYYLNGER